MAAYPPERWWSQDVLNAAKYEKMLKLAAIETSKLEAAERSNLLNELL